MYLRPGRAVRLGNIAAVLSPAAQNGSVRPGALSLQSAAAVSAGRRTDIAKHFISNRVSGKGGGHGAVGAAGNVSDCSRWAAFGDTQLWRSAAAFGNLSASSTQKEKLLAIRRIWRYNRPSIHKGVYL